MYNLIVKEITKEGILQLLSEVCNLLNNENIDYLVYGSTADLLYGNKEIQPHDIDLIVKEEDCERIISSIKTLNFNPIKTPYSIHANSIIYRGLDNKPFDISFDSYEYYFRKHNIDLNNFGTIYVKGINIKVMKLHDLKEKLKEYNK